MFTTLYKDHEDIFKTTKLEELNKISIDKIIWIDLNKPSEAERKQIESIFQINLENIEFILEMEKVFKYIETQDSIILSSNYLLASNEKTEYNEFQATQVLKNHILISHRNTELKSFVETRKRVEANPKLFADGYNVLITIFEIRIDLNANLLYEIEQSVGKIVRGIKTMEDAGKGILLEINDLQEKTMTIRENLIDYQRLLSTILKSDQFSKECFDRVRGLIQEIISLIQQIEFSFDRLANLQNTIMGLINITQNNIIKIFTIISVIFMPPTLIASIYGMNFNDMPEIKWSYGYFYALGLMLTTSLVILWVFKRKKWL